MEDFAEQFSRAIRVERQLVDVQTGDDLSDRSARERLRALRSRFVHMPHLTVVRPSLKEA